MEKVNEAIYKALRDDSEASVGIRALLGNTTTTPFNVFHSFLPESVDFSPSAGAQGFITYQFISGTPDLEQQSEASRLVEEVYQVTAYHRNLSIVEDIQRRVKRRLMRKRGVTDPTSQALISQIKLDNEEPPTFDDVFKVWFRTTFYRAWIRDDDLP